MTKIVILTFLFSIFQVSATPLYNVSVIGAPTTGPLIDGVVGSIQKGSRHRFYSHSSSSQGFLGAKSNAEPLSIKDQPGVFPAPIMGPAAISFCFKCTQDNSSFVPVIIRPDGTVIHGQEMSESNSHQTLIIASPAQTGIYTLFILPNNQESTEALIEASISSLPQEKKSFYLHSFNAQTENELISAEFIY